MKASFIIFAAATALFIGLYTFGVLMPLWAWTLNLVIAAAALGWFVVAALIWGMRALFTMVRSRSA